MLPQTNFFGKWKRTRPVLIMLFTGLLFTAVILTTLSQSQTQTYLPVIYKDGIPETPLPPCDVYFVNEPMAGNNHVWVADDVGRIVTIVNLTTGETMGTDRMEAVIGYNCPGLAVYAPPYQLSGPLTLGHELQAQSDDGGEDTAVVTFNTSATPPAPDLSAAAVLTTATPSATPAADPPTITLLPSCATPPSNPGEITFNVTFTNWPTDQSLALFWDSNMLLFWLAGQHAGDFTVAHTRVVSANPAVYTLMAVSGDGSSDSRQFTVPCPAPADLLIVGAPQLISTPPIIAYQPVQFTAVISNAGDVDVNSLFFVDLFIDPTIVLSTSIPITESDGYTAVSALPAQSTRVVTLTAPLGFGNEPPTHLVYAWVDSFDSIAEPDETNNISPPAVITNVTPAPTPTATNTPSPGGDISGLVYLFEDGFYPQFRATLRLIDDASGQTIATTQSDADGHYHFANIPPPSATYTLAACLVLDGQEYYGYRHAITPPQDLAYISLLPRPCPITPAPTHTPTATPTPTDTPTATPTGTIFPICAVRFVGFVVVGQDHVAITGEIGSQVTIVDLTDGGQVIGIGALGGPVPGYACPGFAIIPVPPHELIQGHVLAAISSDGTTGTTIVLGATPTFTPTYTATPTFTPTPFFPPGSRTPSP